MNQKKAKAIRKEARKIAAATTKPGEQEQPKDQLPQIPIAGCPTCNEHKWWIQLDAYPPYHTTLVGLICSGCKQAIYIGLKIGNEHHPQNPGVTAPPKPMPVPAGPTRQKKVAPLITCKNCGEDINICVCG